MLRMRRSRWWSLFLPGWLFGLILIAALGFYFAFRAPAVVAMVTFWTVLGGGIWAASSSAGERT
jgi:hypothetical protein